MQDCLHVMLTLYLLPRPPKHNQIACSKWSHSSSQMVSVSQFPFYAWGFLPQFTKSETWVLSFFLLYFVCRWVYLLFNHIKTMLYTYLCHIPSRNAPYPPWIMTTDCWLAFFYLFSILLKLFIWVIAIVCLCLYGLWTKIKLKVPIKENNWNTQRREMIHCDTRKAVWNWCPSIHK